MAFRIRESLDTNIVLRLALRDIPEQCLKIVDLFMRHGYIYDVADLAITEAVYVMQKQGNTRQQIVSALNQVLDLEEINYNKSLFDKVFPMYLENPQCSFNDCCLATYAMLNESEPLWTFDKNLAKKSNVAQLLG